MTAARIIPASRIATGTEREKSGTENSAASQKENRDFSLTLGTKRRPCNCLSPPHRSTPRRNTHPGNSATTATRQRQHGPEHPRNPGQGVKTAHASFQCYFYHGTGALPRPARAGARCFHSRLPRAAQRSVRQQLSHPASHKGPSHPERALWKYSKHTS